MRTSKARAGHRTGEACHGRWAACDRPQRCAACRQIVLVGAGCLNWARPDLCGGRSVMTVPTANAVANDDPRAARTQLHLYASRRQRHRKARSWQRSSDVSIVSSGTNRWRQGRGAAGAVRSHEDPLARRNSARTTVRASPPRSDAPSRPGGGRRGKGGSSPCSPCSAARVLRATARGCGPVPPVVRRHAFHDARLMPGLNEAHPRGRDAGMGPAHPSAAREF